MASTRKLNTKDGVPFYEISVSRGRGIPRLTTRWYPPAGWSQKAIDRELIKVAVAFEQKVKAGEVITRQEERIENYRKELEAAQIKTGFRRFQASGSHCRADYRFATVHTVSKQEPQHGDQSVYCSARAVQNGISGRSDRPQPYGQGAAP